MSDRPGGVAKLTRVIASSGASIEDISHDRAFSGPDVFSVRVMVTVQTSDHDQIVDLYQKLRAEGFSVVPSTSPGASPAGLSNARH